MSWPRLRFQLDMCVGRERASRVGTGAPSSPESEAEHADRCSCPRRRHSLDITGGGFLIGFSEVVAICIPTGEKEASRQLRRSQRRDLQSGIPIDVFCPVFFQCRNARICPNYHGCGVIQDRIARREPVRCRIGGKRAEILVPGAQVDRQAGRLILACGVIGENGSICFYERL